MISLTANPAVNRTAPTLRLVTAVVGLSNFPLRQCNSDESSFPEVIG
jgi:hypothetical protein